MDLINTNTPLKKIFLNSKFCKSKYPFIFDLNNPTNLKSKEKLLLSVDSFTITNVINNVNQYNNKLSFDYNGPFTLIIPVGIYSVFSFKDYLNRYFRDNGYDIICYYNPTQYKMSFASTVDFTIINTSLNPTTCGYLIGIDRDNNNNFIFPVENVRPSFTIHLNNHVDFKTKYIYLRINEINTDTLDSTGGMRDNIIRIPVNVQFGELIEYKAVELDKFIIIKNKLSYFTVTLEDEQHNMIYDIPDFQLSLKVQFLTDIIESYEEDEGTINHYIRQMEYKLNEDEDENKILGV